ncbi:MAG: AbrB/MazE/SpoVT family DNA-binding protein [Cellvibrio sp.]|jgi:AbrB family looped-hinge helix DNA binding protein|nr:AbrB/MazE/SpoVT family DNA-binding protein [Cellvibrio sp.]
MLAVKMSEGGRVVIPAELREQLQFKQGDQLLMEVKNGALVVTSKAQRIAQIRDEIRAAMPPVEEGRSLVDELIAERRVEATKEDAEANEWELRNAHLRT